MKNIKKYLIISIYILINLLVFIFTKSLIYFGDSVGLTSVTLGIIYILKPQIFGSKNKKSLGVYPIIAGVVFIFFVNFVV